MCKWGTNVSVAVLQGKTVLVDACIAPKIEMLQKLGIRTIGCCCGHGNCRGNILLENGLVLELEGTL